MVGYVITVNPVTSRTTWSGLAQNFELEIKGEEIGTSKFTLNSFTGATDDVLALRILDGAGYLKPDTRVSGYRPAFYYGVVTSVDRDISEEEMENSNEQLAVTVQCSDFKTYCNSSFVPENTTTTSSPFAYLKAIYDRWLVQDNQNGIPMKCLTNTSRYTGLPFNYAEPLEAGTEQLMTLFGRAFSLYQIPLVAVSDNINSGNTFVLNTMFIKGKLVGVVVIDDSTMVRGADVTERPAGDGDINALAICKPKTKTVTKTVNKKKKKVKEYSSVTKTMRYITTGGTIVSSITNDVRKPIKMAVTIKNDKTKYETIAKNNLSVTPYSHEITFNVSVYHPAIIDGLAEIGNAVKLIYKGKTYNSYVSEVTISSSSEFIKIKCGNSKGKKGLASLIDVNAKKIKGSDADPMTSISIDDAISEASGNLATEADIDGFF